MDVSIIIVHYNVKYFLEQALHSLKRASGNLQVETFVIDNNSPDDSVEWIRDRFPDVHIIANQENVGFAKANNQGMAVARGRYFLILNPDVILQENTLDVLVDFMNQHPDVGAVGPKIISPQGTIDHNSRRSFPTPWVAFCKLSGLSNLFPNSPFFSKYALSYIDPDLMMDVDVLSGACMMVRREAYQKVGGFDEDYFMFGEDIDWCYGIKQTGWRICYNPSTRIIHYKGESTKRSNIKRDKHFYGAMHLFVRKNIQMRLQWLFHPLLDVAIFVRSLLARTGKTLKTLLYPAIDLVLIFCAMLVARYLRFQDWGLVDVALIVTVIYAAIWLGTFASFGVYHRHKDNLDRVVIATLLGFVLNSTFTYFAKQFAFSRLVVLIASFMLLTMLPGWRWALTRIRTKLFGKAFLRRPTLIVGVGDMARTIVEKLRSLPNSPYEILGMVSFGDQQWQPNIEKVPFLGNVRDLDLIIGENHPEEVIFSVESLPYQEIFKIISSLSHHRVDFKVVHSDIMRSSDGYMPLLDVEYRRKRGLKQSVNRAIKLIFP
jgi:GT2 family glycosyltransferase